MTDSEIYANEFKKLVTEKSYILTESKGYTPILEYLKYFEERKGENLFYLVSPSLYEVDILDQFKNNIVYSTFLSSQNGRSLYTLLQIDENNHLYVGYVYSEKKFYVGFEFYCRDSKYFLEFLDNNSQYEYKEKSKTGGFGFGSAAPAA